MRSPAIILAIASALSCTALLLTGCANQGAAAPPAGVDHTSTEPTGEDEWPGLLIERSTVFSSYIDTIWEEFEPAEREQRIEICQQVATALDGITDAELTEGFLRFSTRQVDVFEDLNQQCIYVKVALLAPPGA